MALPQTLYLGSKQKNIDGNKLPDRMLTSEQNLCKQEVGHGLLLWIVRSLWKADMQMMMFSQRALENKRQRYPTGLRTIVIAISGHAT